MSDAKHTPGPWGIEQTEETNWIGRLRSDGSGKAADIVTSTDRFNLTPDATARSDANARLIAAAPELLEVASQLNWLAINASNILHDPERFKEFLLKANENATAAIAKATGATP